MKKIIIVLMFIVLITGCAKINLDIPNSNSSSNNTNTSSNSLNSNSTRNTTSNTSSNTSSADVSSVLPESSLGLTNILNIFLIVIGVLLVLLAIAILIRLKK